MVLNGATQETAASPVVVDLLWVQVAMQQAILPGTQVPSPAVVALLGPLEVGAQEADLLGAALPTISRLEIHGPLVGAVLLEAPPGVLLTSPAEAEGHLGVVATVAIHGAPQAILIEAEAAAEVAAVCFVWLMENCLFLSRINSCLLFLTCRRSWRSRWWRRLLQVWRVGPLCTRLPEP